MQKEMWLSELMLTLTQGDVSYNHFTCLVLGWPHLKNCSLTCCLCGYLTMRQEERPTGYEEIH